ncbi:MAG: DUF481 domain-containing protein [Lysobacterales bacterium]|jgi:putative salt-induced outer membrane protein YdiY
MHHGKHIMLTTLMVVFIPLSTSLSADQVKMSNGDIITGTVTKIEDGKVFIDPAYADEFAVDVAEVASIEAEQTFDIVLEDGSEKPAKFDHGDDGMQTLVIEGQRRNVSMADVTLAVPPKPWYERTSKIEANLTWNSGNTDSQNNLIFADTQLRLGDHRHGGNLTFARDKTGDVYTKKQDLLNYSYNFMIADPWYLGATATYERDPIKDLDHRYQLGAIIGRDLINDDRRFLSINAGVGYSEEQYDGVTESGATGLWDLRYTHDFRDGSVAFFHNHNISQHFYGEDNLIFKSNTGFNFDIIDGIYTSISLRYDYETEPPEGNENEDTTLAVGVGARF